MNVLPALHDQLQQRVIFCGTWERMRNDNILELTIKHPTQKDLRYVVLRITQQDNLISLSLHRRTINLPDTTTAHEEFDLLDTNFLDRLVEAVYRYIKYLKLCP